MTLIDDWLQWPHAPAVAAAVAVSLLIVLAAYRSGRQARARREATALQAQRTAASDAEIAALRVRIGQLAEDTAAHQSELIRSLNERLDRVSHRLGESVDENGRRAVDQLFRLQDRLASIDNAQRSIAELSRGMVSLKDILANKQSRGAFGQGRMEAIVADGLPAGSFSFQPTLSNGKRPDCVIRLPASDAGLVIDAKFPLEAFEALRTASGDGERAAAMRRVRHDVGRHISAIAEKYLIPGETQDIALLFIPSESVFADLHETFEDVVQTAFRSRVIVVSPTILMLAIQTVASLSKGARVRDEADVIQREAAGLLNDMNQLRDRLDDVQRHHGQVGVSIERVFQVSARLETRARRIEAIERGEPAVAKAAE